MKESIDYFLSIASKEEKKTFIHLIKTKPEFAFDYINCWLILGKKKSFSEESFNEMLEHVNMLISTKKVRLK